MELKLLYCLQKLRGEDSEVDSKLCKELELLKTNVDYLHKNCRVEKDDMAKKLKAAENALIQQEPLPLDDLSQNELEELLAKQRRKTEICINQLMQKENELVEVKMQCDSMRHKHYTQLQNYLSKLAVMYTKQNLSSSKELARVDAVFFKDVQNSLNETIKKHRQLLHETEEMKNQHALELQILKQKELDFVSENNLLKGNIFVYIFFWLCKQFLCRETGKVY